MSGLWAAAFAVGAVGSAVAPHLIALFGLVERTGPAERMAEAMTLPVSGLILGQALAAAVAGPSAAAYGHRAAFAVACGAVVTSAVVAAVARPGWLRTAGVDAPRTKDGTPDGTPDVTPALTSDDTPDLTPDVPAPRADGRRSPRP
ncbi:hypothetical protein [Streptomyces sp. NPDC093093]|uniref:hypothetical protein n=1 Tax=Streptomyces sp. NPDC093093 TaxID=3366025 RepID=UPI0037F72B28